MTRLPLVLAAFLLVACARTPRAHVVAMKDFGFAPGTLDVAGGDTIVFRNDDPVPHTATSDASGVSRWSSGDIPPSRRWRWVAGKKGSHPFHCEYHPTMKGVIKVE